MTQNAEPKTAIDELLELIRPIPRPKPALAPKPPKEKYHDGNRGPDERRVAPDKKRTYEVSEMWDVHHEIVRRLLIGHC